MIHNHTDKPFPYLTTLEVGQLKGYSDSRVQKACLRGELPSIRVGDSGPYLIHREDADNWMKEGKTSLPKENRVNLNGSISVLARHGYDIQTAVLTYKLLIHRFPRVLVDGVHLSYVSELGTCYIEKPGADGLEYDTVDINNRLVILDEPERQWERVRLT